MDFDFLTYSLEKVLDRTAAGRIALPDFQREFVWPPAKVIELLDSVSRGWPIGSMLFLAGPQPFNGRPLDSGPDVTGDIGWFVLDGQQRLTSLYHAIKDVSDVVYFVDVRESIESADRSIKWAVRRRFETQYGNIQDRARSGLLLIAELYEEDRFYEWVRHAPHDLASRVPTLRTKTFGGLRSGTYQLPVIELDQGIQLEALARIFETLNRTGVPLNAFDLMVAVTFPKGFRLRDEWELAQSERPRFRQYDIEGLDVLKLVALLARREQQRLGVRPTVKGIRQGDVLAIPPGYIHEGWERAVHAIDQALSVFERRFGVRGPAGIPATAMLLAAAYMLEADWPLAQIEQWYWTAIADQRYGQGANTQVLADIEGRPSSLSTLDTVQKLSASLLEPARRNGILLQGVAGLVTLRHGLDPLTAQPLLAMDEVVDLHFDRVPRRSSEARVASYLFMSPDSKRNLEAMLRRGEAVEHVVLPQSLSSQLADGFFAGHLNESIHVRAQRLTDAISDVVVFGGVSE